MKGFQLRSVLAVLALAVLSACGATRVDLEAWRASDAVRRPVGVRSSVADDLARVDALRGARQLGEARDLALALAAEQPRDGRVAFYASRAESDALVMFAKGEKKVRNAAAASALDFARRAQELGEKSKAARAQLAWALGASTHLQGMWERAKHARRTLEVAEGVVAEDPLEPTALATIAVVNLRLETLPWIARVMASGLPDSSLDDAIAFARRAVAARPSRENRLILAKCLRASGDDAGARAVLEAALAAAPKEPRDDVLEDDVRTELD